MTSINKNSSRKEVLTVVKADGWALEHASDELKNDREIVLEAVNSHGVTLRYASDELKADPELIKISKQ